MSKTIQVARYTADGTQVVRTHKEMGDAGQNMSNRLKQGAAGVSPALRALDAAAEQAKGKVEGLAHHSGSLGHVLQSIGPIGVGAAAGVGVLVLAFHALQHGAQEAVHELGEIAHNAERLGISTQALQEWRFAAAGVGLEASATDAALAKFNDTIGQLDTETGKKARGALLALGFSADELHNLDDLNELLPEIAERMQNLTRREQGSIAKKLGLTELLPLLREGREGMDEARRAAERMGVVLSEDLLHHAAELNGEWRQANMVLDIQLKATLVELAPIFVHLAQKIGETARALRGFIDNFVELEHRSDDSLRKRLVDLTEAMDRLDRSSGGAQDAQGHFVRHGRAATSQDTTIAGVRQYQQALAEVERIQDILHGRREVETTGYNPSENAGSDTTVDAALQKGQQLVEQLRAEARAREDLNALRDQYPQAAQQELDARLALLQRMREIDAARTAGAIHSQQEVDDLKSIAQAGYDAAAGLRASAEAERARQALQNQVISLRQGVETPYERMQREEQDLRELREQSNGDLDEETFARRLGQIRDAYHEIAEAQRQASLEGQVLSGIVSGQIKNWGDLEQMLLHIATDAAIRELLSTGVGGEGGIVGFGQRVLGRISESVTGHKPDASDRAVHELGDAAAGAATKLGKALTPSVAEAAAKMAVSTTATATEISTKGQAALATSFLTKSAIAAASALAKLAATQTGGDVAKVALNALKLGPGRAGGGGMWPGYVHPGAERGVELAVFGGWSHVLPNDTFEGLRALSRIATQAQRQPPAAATSGAVKVIVEDHAGGIDVSARQTVAANGETEVRVALVRANSDAIRRGELNRPMRDQFGISPQRTARS